MWQHQTKIYFGRSNQKCQHIHFHENDHPPDKSPTETSNQTMVYECLSDGGMHPSDINNIMSAFKAKENHLKKHEEKSTPIKDVFL